jgi:hypothetical protein
MPDAFDDAYNVLQDGRDARRAADPPRYWLLYAERL